MFRTDVDHFVEPDDSDFIVVEDGWQENLSPATAGGSGARQEFDSFSPSCTAVSRWPGDLRHEQYYRGSKAHRRPGRRNAPAAVAVPRIREAQPSLQKFRLRDCRSLRPEHERNSSRGGESAECGGLPRVIQLDPNPLPLGDSQGKRRGMDTVERLLASESHFVQPSHRLMAPPELIAPTEVMTTPESIDAIELAAIRSTFVDAARQYGFARVHRRLGARWTSTRFVDAAEFAALWPQGADSSPPRIQMTMKTTTGPTATVEKPLLRPGRVCPNHRSQIRALTVYGNLAAGGSGCVRTTDPGDCAARAPGSHLRIARRGRPGRRRGRGRPNRS